MNVVQTAIAASVVIPGVVVTGMYALPGKEERQAQAAQEAELAAQQKYQEEEETQPFVLQPFYISGGVFIVEMEARGRKGQSVLCGNLPLVHDAVVTALYGKTMNLSTERIQARLGHYGDSIRQQVNSAFNGRLLKRVILTYADLATFNADYRRKKSGTAKRCLAADGTG